MGAKTSSVGGGAAKPLAKDFLAFLRNGLNSGRFSSGNQPGFSGEDPVGKTTDIGAAIDRALSGGFAGKDFTGDILKNVQRERELGVGELLNRFSISGNRYSSGAVSGVGDYLAKSDSELGARLGEIDLNRAALANQSSINALNALFSAYGMAVGKGVRQAETVVTPGALDTIGGLAGAGASVYKTAKGV